MVCLTEKILVLFINPLSTFPFLLLRCCCFFSLASLSEPVAMLRKGQFFKDGDYMVSVDDTFELCFFGLKNETLRYLGIRYHNLPNPAIIWVANRDRPITDRNGVLKLGEDGNLLLSDGNENPIWTSDAKIPSTIETVASLEKTGNLLLSSSENIGDVYKAYWQSFHSPTDTYLPNMKILVQGENHAFTSWTSPDDPSPGRFSTGIDSRGAPQIVIWKLSSRVWRSGHWDGQIFSGVPSMSVLSNFQYGFKVTPDPEDSQVYVTYNPSNASDLVRFRISYKGIEEQLRWNESASRWDVMLSEPADECENYNYCGNFGVCNFRKTPICSCLKGFKPRNLEQWNKGNFSGGCQRSSHLQCQKNIYRLQGKDDGPDGFVGIKSVKLPDLVDFVDAQASFDSCKDMCTKNCSCNAYARITGIGCMIWNGDLIDIQHFEKPGGGNMLYLRLPASELGGNGLSTLAIVLIVAGGVIFLFIIVWLLWILINKFKARPLLTSTRKSEKSLPELSRIKDLSTERSGPGDFLIEGNSVSGSELILFNFVTVAAATNNFSEENRLGQGGFGPVYKGKLQGGQEIAVKRLSKISGQGLEEFKNEVILIARLQHRNLVRLLGCCIDGEEKMLLYEYMANGSLDSFIFDPLKQALLDWKKRFTIIEGIARGLVYLHRDSRLRIIHRDLKASNILLDEEMNPKISDFGMARIFGGNQNVANTNRVVGTHGYMSPEYAMEGLISVKLDVYSFGVLLLEIVSGQRNTGFRSTDHVNLIAYAWELWIGLRVMEIVDPSVRDSCVENEVLRCIQVGMLCVQDSAGHRPSMDSVVLMLETENASVPMPREPTFTSIKTFIESKTTEVQETVSTNNLTITAVAGR